MTSEDFKSAVLALFPSAEIYAISQLAEARADNLTVRIFGFGNHFNVSVILYDIIRGDCISFHWCDESILVAWETASRRLDNWYSVVQKSIVEIANKDSDKTGE